MEYKVISGKEMNVSRIAQGTWAIGGWMWGGTDERESIRTIHAAFDKGINLIDTAPVYCFGVSEEIVGKAIEERGHREKVFIATKVGLEWHNGSVTRNSSPGRIRKEVQDSLRRLRTDYIDIYQVHRLDPHTPVEETMYSLDQLVRSGKVRYIGGSTMPAYKFAQMCLIARWHGYSRPIAMQNLYNLIQREEDREMNQLCLEEGVGLIPYSPLARGFLAGNRSRDGGGETERSRNDAHVKAGMYRDCDWEIAERCRTIAAAYERSPAQVALAWLMTRPSVAAPIASATTVEQLDELLKAMRLTLDAQALRELDDASAS